MRSAFFFLFWFLWTGAANIIPQTYFLSHDPAHKVLAISLLLMLGALVSVVGILLGGQLPRLLISNGQKGHVLILAMFAVCLSSFIALFWDLPSIGYFFSYLLFRFVSCLLYQFLDISVIHGSEPEMVSRHNHNAMIFMFAAITVSPLFFAYTSSFAWIAGVVIALALSTGFFLRHAMATRAMDSVPAIGSGFSINSGTDAYLLLYAAAYISIIYMTSYLLVFFIHDYYQLHHAVHQAGWIMLVTSASAVAGSMFYANLRRNVFRDMNSAGVQAVIIGFQIGAMALLFLKLSDSMLFLCSCTSLMGFAYGMFMVLTRQYAGEVESKEKNGMLALYNLLPYISTVISFSIVGGIRLAATGGIHDFYMDVGGFIALLLSLVMIFMLLHSVASRKQPDWVGRAAADEGEWR